MKDSAGSRIAIVGAGYMGGGMAQTFALAGFDCVIADVTTDAAIEARERLIRETRHFEEHDLFGPGSAELVNAHVSAATSIEDAAIGASYIAEVVSEDRQVKSLVLQRISAASAPDAIIASNTSAIPISKLTHSISRPDRFLGAHWMNPAPFIPAVELIASPETSEETISRAESLLESVGKVPCRVGDTPGFIANRLQFTLFKEACRMVEEEAATAEQIDTIVSNSFGFRLPFFGPFAIADMAGLDVYAGAYSSLVETYGDRFAAPNSLTEKVTAGELGTKTRGGYTDLHTYERAELALKRDRSYAALANLKAELEELDQPGQHATS